MASLVAELDPAPALGEAEGSELETEDSSTDSGTEEDSGEESEAGADVSSAGTETEDGWSDAGDSEATEDVSRGAPTTRDMKREMIRTTLDIVPLMMTETNTMIHCNRKSDTELNKSFLHHSRNNFSGQTNDWSWWRT